MNETIERDEPQHESETVPNPNQGLIDGMRECADWMEAHPESGYAVSDILLNIFTDDLATVARAGFGPLKKEIASKWFWLAKHFGNRVAIHWMADREKVCERVVTGTKITPAKPARVVTLPAEEAKVEEEFTWVCPDSILKAAESEPALPPDGVNGLYTPNVASLDPAPMV